MLVTLVSCRLPHEHIIESIFLEQMGFRFIEMVLHPILIGLDGFSYLSDTLVITEAEERDIPCIENIAENAFSNERYHVDPRINSSLANSRYAHRVRNYLEYSHQQLYKIEDSGNLVGFLIIEISEEGRAYWHLTAIAPAYQGQGYGKRFWLALSLGMR